jgi:hypothetical protein
MLQFLQANTNLIIQLVIITALWFLIGLSSIKGDVNSLDKKRIAKGLSAMTDEEKQLVKQSFRSSVISNAGQAFFAGIISLIILTYFL